jgi:hypothetical protein
MSYINDNVLQQSEISFLEVKALYDAAYAMASGGPAAHVQSRDMLRKAENMAHQYRQQLARQSRQPIHRKAA